MVAICLSGMLRGANEYCRRSIHENLMKSRSANIYMQIYDIEDLENTLKTIQTNTDADK